MKKEQRDEILRTFFRAVPAEDEFCNPFRRPVFAIYEGKPSFRKPPMGREGKFAPFYELFGRS